MQFNPGAQGLTRSGNLRGFSLLDDFANGEIASVRMPAVELRSCNPYLISH